MYIEIPVHDISDKEDQAAILQNLKDISNSLYSKIQSNTASKQYIEDNKLNAITISFYIPWHEAKFITYNYKPKK